MRDNSILLETVLENICKEHGWKKTKTVRFGELRLTALSGYAYNLSTNMYSEGAIFDLKLPDKVLSGAVAFYPTKDKGKLSPKEKAVWALRLLNEGTDSVLELVIKQNFKRCAECGSGGIFRSMSLLSYLLIGKYCPNCAANFEEQVHDIVRGKIPLERVI